LSGVLISFCPEVKGGEDIYSAGALRKVKWLRLALSKGPNWVGVFSPLRLRTVRDPVSETSCIYSQKHRTVQDVQKPSNSIYSNDVNYFFNCIHFLITKRSSLSGRPTHINAYAKSWFQPVTFCYYLQAVMVSAQITVDYLRSQVWPVQILTLLTRRWSKQPRG
jgi:hypothetical protein